MAKKGFKTSWKANKEEYFLYHKAREISSHTRFHWAGDDIVVFYPKTDCTYLLRDFELCRDGKMRPAEVVSTNGKTTHIIKKRNRFLLVHKGEPYQEETARTFIDHILVIYDRRHKVTRFISNFRNRQDGLIPAESYLPIERTEAMIRVDHEDSCQIIWRGREIRYMLNYHNFGKYRLFYHPQSRTAFVISNEQWRTWKRATVDAKSEFDTWAALIEGQHFFPANPTLWVRPTDAEYNLFHNGEMNPEGVHPVRTGIHGILYLPDENKSLVLDSFFMAPENELFQAVEAAQYFKDRKAEARPATGSPAGLRAGLRAGSRTSFRGGTEAKKEISDSSHSTIQTMDGNYYFWAPHEHGVHLVFKGKNILDNCKVVRLPWDDLLIYHDSEYTTMHLKGVGEAGRESLKTAKIVSQDTPLVVAKTTDKKFRLYNKGESILHHMDRAELSGNNLSGNNLSGNDLIGNNLIVHFRQQGTARAGGFSSTRGKNLIPAVFDSGEE